MSDESKKSEKELEGTTKFVKALKKIIGNKSDEKVSDNELRDAIKGDSVTSSYRKPRKKP
jgi:hypothetical protein